MIYVCRQINYVPRLQAMERKNWGYVMAEWRDLTVREKLLVCVALPVVCAGTLAVSPLICMHAIASAVMDAWKIRKMSKTISDTSQ